MHGVLEGVRVLDLSEYIAGPIAGEMLADLGADVVKVEPPNGDFWRHTGPVAPGESRGFMGVNKGKRSISLDLKHPDARPVFERAVLSADVLLANYRPGVATRLRVDYETLSALNPRLIYCANTAFGSKGPYRDRAGFDLATQAMAGIMSFEGAGGPPRPVISTSPTDLSAGMFMAYGVAAALYHRERTGRGQFIETSLFAAGLAIQYRPMFSIEKLDRAPREAVLAAIRRAREEGRRVEELLGDAPQQDAARRNNPYYRVYETRDSYVALACLNNRLRRVAAAVLGVEDPRVSGAEFDPASVSDEDALVTAAYIEAVFTHRTTAEWVAAFDEAGVPCGAVQMSAELFVDPQVAADNLLVEMDHAVLGKVIMANSPLRMSGGETGTRRASPALGQHTREVLGELGYSAGEVAALEQAGAVRAWQPAR